MSTMYSIDKYEFHNRKPSKKQIDSCIKNAMEQGSKALAIIWGENQIDLDFYEPNHTWYGSGHIKNISGWDIAIELNSKEENKTLNLWNT
jgi:hypothetical protein